MKVRMLVFVVAVIPRIGLAIDLDNDGMSDVWERLYDPNDALLPDGDADADGFTNLFESLAGTDPHDADDFLQLHLEPVDGGLEISWDEQLGKHYSLESSQDLEVWGEVDVLEPIDFPSRETGAPPTGSTQTELLDSWHPWEPGYGGFDFFWSIRYGFEANAGDPDYGFDAHLDADMQANFVESYAATDPGAIGGRMEAWLDIGRSRLRLEFYGTGGDLRYDLEFAVAGAGYNPGNIVGSPFEPWSADLDANFVGAVADHTSEPARIRTYIPGLENERETPDYLPPDISLPSNELHPSEAEFHDAGDGVLLIEWPETPSHAGVAILTRALIGDWFFGRTYLTTVQQPQNSGSGGTGGRDFFRISVFDPTAAANFPNLWERYAMLYQAPDQDWGRGRCR